MYQTVCKKKRGESGVNEPAGHYLSFWFALGNIAGLSNRGEGTLIYFEKLWGSTEGACMYQTA